MDTKEIALKFDNGGHLTVEEGNSYVVRPLELSSLDINSFMSVLRRALPTAFTASNSNGVVRIKGPRGFECSFSVEANRGTLTGKSETHGLLFQYPVGRINAINLLKRIFMSVWVEPSDTMVLQSLREKFSNIVSAHRQLQRRRHAIFGDVRTPRYTITLRTDDTAMPQPFPTDHMYLIELSDGKFKFLGEYHDDDESYGESTLTVEQLQMEIDALQDRLNKAKEVKALVETCTVDFAFTLTPSDLTNK